jgi:hypothetical protein
MWDREQCDTARHELQQLDEEQLQRNLLRQQLSRRLAHAREVYVEGWRVLLARVAALRRRSAG